MTKCQKVKALLLDLQSDTSELATDLRALLQLYLDRHCGEVSTNDDGGGGGGTPPPKD